MKLGKNPKFIPSWENVPFDGPERYPRGIKFRLKIEGVFLPQPIPNLHMADKSVHFTRFLANLVPKVLNDACAILLRTLQGYIAPKSLLLIALSMPIYSKGVYFLPPSDFSPAHK